MSLKLVVDVDGSPHEVEAVSFAAAIDAAVDALAADLRIVGIIGATGTPYGLELVKEAITRRVFVGRESLLG